MVDLAVVDLSIFRQQFKSEEDVRTAMITEDETASTFDSDRRGKCHAGLSKLINDIIDKDDDCEEEEDEEHHHIHKAEHHEEAHKIEKKEAVVEEDEDLLGKTGVSIINEVPVVVTEPVEVVPAA